MKIIYGDSISLDRIRSIIVEELTNYVTKEYVDSQNEIVAGEVVGLQEKMNSFEGSIVTNLSFEGGETVEVSLKANEKISNITITGNTNYIKDSNTISSWEEGCITQSVGEEQNGNVIKINIGGNITTIDLEEPLRGNSEAQDKIILSEKGYLLSRVISQNEEGKLAVLPKPIMTKRDIELNLALGENSSISIEGVSIPPSSLEVAVGNRDLILREELDIYMKALEIEDNPEPTVEVSVVGNSLQLLNHPIQICNNLVDNTTILLPNTTEDYKDVKLIFNNSSSITLNLTSGETSSPIAISQTGVIEITFKKILNSWNISQKAYNAGINITGE